MTTVADPLGTPVPAYNRSGTVIISVSGGPNSDPPGPTLIPALTERTIALLSEDPMSSAAHFILTDTAEVGDAIEAYGVSGFTPIIRPPSGETFFDGGSSPLSISGAHKSVVFRRISTTQWAVQLSA